MTREEFFAYCLSEYGTTPDFPFENDFETAVMRHSGNRKWYALVMRVKKEKFGICGGLSDTVNMKLPEDLSGAFGPSDGVFPAYHMNKRRWISVLLDLADGETVKFLLHASYCVTSPAMPRAKRGKEEK